MQKALFFKKLDHNHIECLLCPHYCIIAEDRSGICQARENRDGDFFANTYGNICSISIDPIEKKPLYHFHPSKNILSIGSVGCNLRCNFCQNWEISQTNTKDFHYLNKYSPIQIADIALKKDDNIGVAYTYNEPTVWYELMYDTAKEVRNNGQKNVMVTNGFINPEPLKELFKYIDAFSVDLKAFNDNFYKEYANARLEPVKQTLVEIARNKKHLEITNLVITDLNDDLSEFEEMLKWINSNLGKDVVLHISRYFPAYRVKKEATSEETLTAFCQLAKKYLNYVYLGNVMSNSCKQTICPACKKEVARREGYKTELIGLTEDGRCNKCGHKIISYI